MKWTCPRFAVLLAIALSVWLWPSIFGGKAFVPFDILQHIPPHEPAAGTHVHNGLIGDLFFENYVWHQHQREALAGGEFPLWNPATFCGHPLYTSGQSSTFYPLNAILLLLPLAQAYVVYIWVHLMLGGIFMYLMCRRFGVGPFGCSIAGLTFAMSGYFAFHFVFPMLVASAVWLPLAIVWIDALAAACAEGRARWWRIAAGAPLFALPVLAGFFEVAFYCTAAAGLFALFALVRVWRRAGFAASAGFIGRFTLTGALAICLAAPQLLPFLEVKDRTIRAGELDYSMAVAGGVKGYELLTLIMPDVLGNPAAHEGFSLTDRQWHPIKGAHGGDSYYFGPKNYVEIGFYFGIVPLVFVLLGLGRRGHRAYFWLAVAMTLGFVLGTPLYRLFYHMVPGSDQVRTPFRWMAIATFAGSYLAGLGAQAWHEHLTRPSNRASRVVSVAAAILLIAALVAVIVLLFVPGPVQTLAERLLRENVRAKANFRTVDDLAGLLWTNGFRLAAFAAGAAVVVALAFLRSWGPRAAGAISLAAFAVVAVDLGQASYSFNTHADTKVLQVTPPLIAHMQADKGLFRFARYGPEKPFYPNSHMLYGLQDYGGYDSILLRDYAHYLNAIERQKLLMYNIATNFEEPASLDSPLIPLMNVRYMVTPRKIEHPDWQQVPVGGNLKLYRLRPEKEIPRAFLVDAVQPAASLDEALARLKGGRARDEGRGARDEGRFDVRRTAVVLAPADVAAKLVEPAGWHGLAGEATPNETGRGGVATAPSAAGALTGASSLLRSAREGQGAGIGSADITDYKTSRVRIATDAPGRRLLVLLDIMYPGWHAYIDGQHAETYTTDGIFRGVSVPAGRHTVEFRFEPASLRIGLTLCAAALLVMSALCAISVLGPKR